MAIQASFNKIKSESIVRLSAVQVVVKASIDVSSDEGVILGASADARALAIEPMQGEVQVNGKVNFKAIYSSNANGVLSLDYNADFTDSIKENSISPSSKLLINLNVIDTESNLTGGNVMLTAVVEIVVDEVKAVEAEALASVDEEVFAKYDNVNTQQLTVMAEGAFELFEEIETSIEVDKILIFDANVIATSNKCGVNTVIVGGEAFASVSYKAQDNIHSKNLVIPFSEEIDANGANPESFAISELVIKSKRIVLSGAKDDNIIRAEMVIAVKASVFNNQSAKVISDLYSPKVSIQAEETQLNSAVHIKEYSYKEKISAQANLEADMPPIKNVLSCCLARNNIANLIPGNNEMTVEGLMSVFVLYLDEENRPTAVKAELPYSLLLPADNVMENDILSGKGAVFNTNAKAVSPNEIEVKSDIRLQVNTGRRKGVKVITKLMEGETKDIKLNAASIFIASGGEEMWDIVKSLSASPNEIEAQNPNLTLPLPPGRRVRIYRRI